MITTKNLIFISLSILGSFSLGYFGLPKLYSVKYLTQSAQVLNTDQQSLIEAPIVDIVQKNIEVGPFDRTSVTHTQTPEPLKAIYMSSWVASTTDFRNKLIKIIDETEINTVVIDIKDYTGKIAFEVSDPYLQKIGSSEKRISDIIGLISLLHSKGIYVIGRVAVFQDPYLIKSRPDLAVKQFTDKSIIWTDHKGIGWLDAGSQDVWDYIIAISNEAYADGFDEINYDYIRFPSDGNMKNIYFPISEGKSKPEVVKGFFMYLHDHLKNTGIKTSADVFGMVATNTDDLNIGQVLENTLPYFDYVAPMVYPSHFPPTWNGYKNPAAMPYETIQYSMNKAVERAKAIGENPLKLRPWLQDFSLGATYTSDMVRAQIKATYDVGLTSWMLWDPANTYTVGALEKN
ncbi:MAG: putative glycoside hydrolase [Candidatus Paceibacterota bacterium]|jgi:hypothetical protein